MRFLPISLLFIGLLHAAEGTTSSLGNMQPAILIKKVDPVYPALAMKARVQGTVRFSAEISEDGTLQDIQPLSGHRLLIPAALDAVKHWIYSPTTLHGAPFAIRTQIEVNFSLKP